MSSKTKTTATKEEARPALVPKLRFPEFRGGDAWEPTTIGALGRFYYGKSAPKWSLAEDAPTPCVRYGELYTKFGPAITETYSRTNTDPETLRFSKGGEILIPRVGEKPEDFGKCCAYLPLKGIAIGEMISVLETKQHPLFYTYYFRHLYKQFAKVVEGQNVKNLYFTELEPLPIHRPSIPEQQKIAECLSSVDELMVAQARKVDALKTHKKGLMQQLFPREGETQPRLRFPEFQNAGEWEDSELGPKASKVGSGITPTGGDKNYKRAGLAFVRSQNVGWGILMLDDVAYIDEETHASFDSTEIKVSDVLLNITGASIGRSAVADERVAGGNVNQHVCIIRTKPDELNPFYLNQYLISQRGQRQIDSFQAGGNRQGLNFAQIRSFVVPLPPILAEQHRLASCLSSLDALITVETQKLEALKTHKKGLMQQLFPSPEEVEA
ncbi:restriction endonuclease subunit S [Candidatus Methylospira mobilis]|uniref:restriction endonuclease subunit S n=1 Tax=Candidatus Methylospira mobilis TaxID=1808979 RepID=UPI0028E34B7A|nr:restriction endonuclease subunit S [Candidatus Methylospira mobilis]WNV04943.1 restriction endonuclease subunit S [Candidatus Methylospira mobilis]